MPLSSLSFGFSKNDFHHLSTHLLHALLMTPKNDFHLLQAFLYILGLFCKRLCPLRVTIKVLLHSRLFQTSVSCFFQDGLYFSLQLWRNSLWLDNLLHLSKSLWLDQLYIFFNDCEMCWNHQFVIGMFLYNPNWFTIVLS